MKTILWATLCANGNYAQSSPDNPPKKEALNDFAEHAKAAGNFIVGRRTFEGMAGNGPGPFAELDIVVVSQNTSVIPGVMVASSPQEALGILEKKGHQTALIAGGADDHNSFLENGLVDELIFNVAPILEGKGLHLQLHPNDYMCRPIELLHCKSLGNGVVQLHYAIPRS
ncbi:MAG TPA: dihydrofolate reductase [Candidatus Bathyarchaeia archaeon]|nr:dihydrofolate reductase [Candidatus Bathyarchaeia archaeon]